MPMARRLGPGMLGHTGFTGRNRKLHEMMVGTCGTFVLETSTQQGDSNLLRQAKDLKSLGSRRIRGSCSAQNTTGIPNVGHQEPARRTAERWMISNSCSNRPVTSGYIRCVSEYLQVVYCPDVLDILINDVKCCSYTTTFCLARIAQHTQPHTHTTHLEARITVLLAHNNRTACMDSTCSICYIC